MSFSIILILIIRQQEVNVAAIIVDFLCSLPFVVHNLGMSEQCDTEEEYGDIARQTDRR